MIHKTKNIHHKRFLLIIVIVILITYFIYPSFYHGVIAKTDFSSIIEILFYLPAFLLLMGLFEAWLPSKFLMEHLGKQAGIKGSLYSFAIGSVIPGPLYLGFPVARLLLRKGVNMFNVALFIGAWSGFKVFEEVFELQFLGLKFLLLRVIISIPFIILSAFVIDRFHFKN